MIDYSEIDELMQPLVEAMNGTGWIQTISFCQGHPGSQYHSKTYIAFFIDAAHVGVLAKILNDVEKKFKHTFMFDCKLVHNASVNGCQADAPPGWIALDLSFEYFLDDGDELTPKVLAALAKQFNKIA